MRKLFKFSFPLCNEFLNISSLDEETIPGEETIQGRKLYEEIRYSHLPIVLFLKTNVADVSSKILLISWKCIFVKDWGKSDRNPWGSYILAGKVDEPCNSQILQWLKIFCWFSSLNREIPELEGKGHEPSRAELKKVQLEPWLEPARLGLITNSKACTSIKLRLVFQSGMIGLDAKAKWIGSLFVK